MSPARTGGSFAALSRADLAVLVPELLLCGQLIDRSGMAHLISAFGREGMAEVAIEEWQAASPWYTRRMQRALNYEGDDVVTIFKGLQLDIGAPPQFMDFRYRVDDRNHGEFQLDHCGALMDVEPLGDAYVTAMCHDIEDPTFDATAVATSHPTEASRTPLEIGDGAVEIGYAVAQVATDLRLIDHVDHALGADVGAEPAQDTARAVDVDVVVALQAARPLGDRAAGVIADLDQAGEVATQLRRCHGDVLALDGLVLLRHVVLERLRDGGAIDDRQLFQVGPAHAGQPAIHGPRGAPPAAGRRTRTRSGRRMTRSGGQPQDSARRLTRRELLLAVPAAGLLAATRPRRLAAMQAMPIP